MERGKNRRTQRKTSRRGRKPTTNSYHFIYQKHEKGTPFSRSLPIKAIVGSTGNPLPGRGKGSKCLPLLHSCSVFSVRSRFTCCICLSCCIYTKKVVVRCRPVLQGSSFAKFVPVYFLIQGNVTLGLMFAICRKRDSKYLDFPLNDYYNP